MRDDRQYLSDIVEAAELIDQSIKSSTFDEFLRDQVLQRSVLFNFTIIGEAANKVSLRRKESYPEIEWSSLVGFRNIIVHAYFSLNLETVWKAATRRVLPLAEQIRAILRLDFREDGSDPE